MPMTHRRAHIHPPAKAYLDAGTGAMIFQMLIAGVMAAGFYFATTWKRAKDWFARLTGRAPEGSADHAPGDHE